ncbi:MAG: RagB/SusD family nutrient uptake outer membrane protein [Gemmatimonadota bacterium]|nr:RagB/SusD family nutrient uptake outer membrane protein [Gemmatimonadota bacterium]
MQRHPARIARSKAWAFLSIATLCAALACSNLLDVKAPDQINTSSLEVPASAQLLVFSSIGDFDCAYTSYIVASGLMSGEFIETTLTAARWSYDRRDTDPNESLYSTNSCEGLGTYTPISTARFTADHVLDLLEGWSDTDVPNRQYFIAQAASYAGYSRILLGEGFCTAAIAGGPALTSQQIFQLAVGKFDTAVTAAQAATNDSTLNLALVGRARAKLDAGDNAGAIADASAVPVGFKYYATYDGGTDHRTNRVYAENNAGNGVSVAFEYDSLNDPRVSVTDEHNTGSDRHTELWTQNKYSSGSAPILIASYVEAQLILAEATGGSQAITILNGLRSTIALPPLASSSDPAVIKADIAAERARWLFLQGTHLFDVRRLSLPLVPNAGDSYSRVYHKGGNYGSETCLPIPAVETNNNPNARNPPAG